MRRWVCGGLALFAAGCGGSDPVAVQLEVDSGCPTCAVEAEGSGLLVISAEMGSEDVAPREGEHTLYAEVPLPNGRTAVLELGFDRGELAAARYREIEQSRVVFRGRAERLSGRTPRAAGRSPAAGHFAFEVIGADEARAVRGSILPAGGDAVEVPPSSQPYVRGTTSSGCDGEVYVPPPVIDDPYVGPDPSEDPDVAPDPGPAPSPDPYDPDPGPPPYEDENGRSPPPPPPSGGGCEGDAYDDDDMAASGGGGCEGDGYDDDMASSGGGGCEGDGYDDMSSSSGGGGCEGDDYEGGGENAEGCEGAATAAVVLPFTPRLLGSVARFAWPFALCGAVNRGARRRRRAPR